MSEKKEKKKKEKNHGAKFFVSHDTEDGHTILCSGLSLKKKLAVMSVIKTISCNAEISLIPAYESRGVHGVEIALSMHYL